MRSLIAGSVLVVTVLLAGTVQAADLDTSRHRRPVRYRVANLPTLGGTFAEATGVNNRGWVTGYSNLPGDQTRHAALWRRGSVLDLGTLGGPNSAILWPQKSLRGVVVGIAQTDEPDPLNESWSCSAFFPDATATGHQCLGFRWERGRMRPLPTLGGTHGFAAGANNRGQVVGWAENKVHDPTCVAPQVLQFRAVIWGPGRHQMRELPPLPGTGDTSTAAVAINDRGRAIGISGICDIAVGRFTARHAVIWENGRPIDIGNIGGVAWTTPMAINQRGDVVGFGNFRAEDGGDFNPHAWMWTERDGMRDLGTLPGDTTSQALGINERRDVVGISCGDDTCRAVLWRNGRIIDLNTRLADRYDDHLFTANDIDDRGRITGRAIDSQTNERVPFVATPHRR